MNRKQLAVATSFVTLASAAVGLGIGTGQAAPAPGYTLKATPVTKADLPRHHDLRLDRSTASFKTVQTYRGDGQAPISACQTYGWKQFKPNTIWTREYRDQHKQYAAASIASFKTHKQAVAAADAMGKGLAGCGRRMVASNPDLLRDYREYNRTVTLPTGQRARVIALNITDGETGNHMLVEAGVTVTGTHVELVTMEFSGMQAIYRTAPIENTLSRTVKTLV